MRSLAEPVPVFQLSQPRFGMSKSDWSISTSPQAKLLDMHCTGQTVSMATCDMDQASLPAIQGGSRGEVSFIVWRSTCLSLIFHVGDPLSPQLLLGSKISFWTKFSSAFSALGSTFLYLFSPLAELAGGIASRVRAISKSSSSSSYTRQVSYVSAATPGPACQQFQFS